MATPTAADAGFAAAQPCPGGGSRFGGRIAAVGYGVVCLHILCFSILALFEPGSYYAFALEDSWMEYFTSVWFLAAGAILFAAARFGRGGGKLARGMYILAGIGLVFVAGEEISWGQRIIGFATPGYLLDINIQEEFSVHNIRTTYTEPLVVFYKHPALVWCIIAIAAFFCGRDRLLGIPMPSFLMILGIIAVSAYEHEVWSPRYLYFIFYQTTMLLPLLACYAVISGRVKSLPAIISAVAIVGGKAYAMQQTYLDAYYDTEEFTEYLLGIISVWYAVEILLSQKRLAIVLNRPGRGLKLPAMIAPQRLGTAVCVLVIAVGIGLALLAHFTIDTRWSAYFYTSYVAPVADAEQVSSSVFNVFSKDGRLYYFRDNCAPADIAELFFLHIYAVQASDLPDSRRQHGFENRDFDFARHGTLHDGQCAATIPLPGYSIASIVTGQYIPDGPQLWKAEFALPPAP